MKHLTNTLDFQFILFKFKFGSTSIGVILAHVTELKNFCIVDSFRQRSDPKGFDWIYKSLKIPGVIKVLYEVLPDIGKQIGNLSERAGNQERKSLYKMIGSIEFFSCSSKITGCIPSFLFCGGDDDTVCPGGGKNGLCNVVHAKRTLHNKDPIRMSSTMMFQFT